MNSIFKILLIVCLLLIISLKSEFCFSQKKTEKSYPIPENVNTILRPFCYSCHGAGGGRLPHSRLNFAIWNGYTPGKQAEKAASICTSMKKGTMPTKLWNQQNPGLRLTGEQIEIVCKWAESVKLEAGKNSHRATVRKQRNAK